MQRCAALDIVFLFMIDFDFGAMSDISFDVSFSRNLPTSVSVICSAAIFSLRPVEFGMSSLSNLRPSCPGTSRFYLSFCLSLP